MSDGLTIAAKIRAMRALLGWSQEELAAAAQTGLSVVRDFESLRRATRDEGLEAMKRTLETAGVVFLKADGDVGADVRLPGGRILFADRQR